jgi:D-alanyl-D-alanine carboxypeptidase (penicillin-binding protein 5/6)
VIRYRKQVTAPDSVEATAPVPDATAPEASALDALGLDAPASVAPRAQWAPAGAGATALTWVDPAVVADAPPVAEFDAVDRETAGASLLAGAHLRPVIARPAALVPLGVLAGLLATYAGTTLLWPLHEVAPTVTVADVAAAQTPAAAITWPQQGSAAVGVGGIGTVASTGDRAAIASVTKVVSTLMVLDRMPLAPGEQGPEFAFTKADSQAYWSYRRSDQSALDVPVGGTLTELQMLQGTLLGSANNYIDRLAKEIWGSNQAFAAAAKTWLSERDLDGITVVTPSGFDEGNVATPEALVALAELAMQNPVFSGIVGMESVELPGAGRVVNTNGMLADPGVVGVKTGTLGESWNLLTAKDVEVDGTTVRLYAAVLGQGDDDMRLEATRSLFSQTEAELQGQGPVVEEGTVVGTVTTLWGASADIVTDAETDVVRWNAATTETTVDIDLGEHREAGDRVGALTATGPLNSVTTPLALAQQVDGPSAWWRLTHPLELFGLADDSRR